VREGRQVVYHCTLLASLSEWHALRGRGGAGRWCTTVHRLVSFSEWQALRRGRGGRQVVYHCPPSSKLQ